MNWWQPHIFEQRVEYLKTRQKVIKAVRRYFDEHDFDEVQTPVLQVMGAPDTHIKPFQTEDYELHTSPEIAMKKLLVAGMEKIYQICPVFRREIEGKLHAQEFTMLEWYRTDTDYTAMMEDCEALIKSLGMFTDKAFERLSVADAFQNYADIDILGDLRAQAKEIGVRITETDTWEDIFHAVMAEKIEPYLGKGRPTFLIDYPVSMAALARKAKDERFAERFELYIDGIEIANAFSELTDPIEQKTRLESDLKAKKELYGIDTPIDDDFIQALEHGMPEASGCALGLDRLIMIACEADNIDDVLWCSKS